MAPDIGLDLKLSTAKIITNFSKQASSIQETDKRIAKLEDYIKNLEEEKRKIEVFKRELPLCFFLLDDVIAGMKDEVERCKSGRNTREFMPVNSKLEDEVGVKLENDCKDEKMNWMSSVQLWNDSYSDDKCHNKNNKINKHVNKNNSESGDESDHRQECETPSLEPAFVPEKPTGRSPAPVPESSHVSLQSPQQQPGLRKPRRCWSPELHRGFVLALEQLGGAQVATPKQIRELMKVDGLTNDEVKSHLQASFPSFPNLIITPFSQTKALHIAEIQTAFKKGDEFVISDESTARCGNGSRLMGFPRATKLYKISRVWVAARTPSVDCHIFVAGNVC